MWVRFFASLRITGVWLWFRHISFREWVLQMWLEDEDSVTKCVFDLGEWTCWRSELGQVASCCLWGTTCYLGAFIDGCGVIIAAL